MGDAMEDVEYKQAISSTFCHKHGRGLWKHECPECQVIWVRFNMSYGQIACEKLCRYPAGVSDEEIKNDLEDWASENAGDTNKFVRYSFKKLDRPGEALVRKEIRRTKHEIKLAERALHSAQDMLNALMCLKQD